MHLVDEDWADWNNATYTPLTNVDADLADQLRLRLVDGILRQAGLSEQLRGRALEEVGVDVGMTPRGTRILRATLPLGSGQPEYEWDGSAAGALSIVDSMAETEALNLRSERALGLPTGWEID